MVKEKMDMIAALAVTGSSIILIVLALVWFARVKLQIEWKVILVGVWVLILFQGLTRGPLVFWIQKNYGEHLKNDHFYLYLTLLCFSAGVFEEIGRWIGFKFWLPQSRDPKHGFGYGVGHGGIEAVFVGASILWGAIQIHTSPAVAEKASAQIAEHGSLILYAGLVERISAIVVQIGLSLVVLYAVKSRQILYLLLAIFLHGLTNEAGLLTAHFSKNIWLAQAVIFLMCVLVAYAGLLSAKKIKTPSGE